MSEVTPDLKVEEVAALVCTRLERHGIRAVLSGGAVVSIYSDNAYESKDLDFIVEGIAKTVGPALEELGFARKQGRHWVHPQTEYWVEFPPGPLQIGNETIRDVAELQTRVGTLRLLHPTESVMDRLAAFYHWNDPQALEQAVLVSRQHKVDLSRIRTWSTREGAKDKLKEYERRLEEDE